MMTGYLRAPGRCGEGGKCYGYHVAVMPLQRREPIGHDEFERMRNTLIALIGAILVLDLWFIVLMNRDTAGTTARDAGNAPAVPAPVTPVERPGLQSLGNQPKGNELIRGRVLDRFNAPVAGATVELHQRDLDPDLGLETYSKAPRWRTLSDDQGQFWFREIPAGSYVARAIYNDLHAIAGIRLAENGPAAEPLLTLQTTLMVKGTLLESDGQPISGAWVYAAARSAEAGAAPLYRLFPGSASAEGKFALPLLAVDTWSVLAVVRGRSYVLSPPVSPTADSVTMVATPGAAARGRVVFPDGQPAKRVSLEAREATMGLERIRIATDLYGVALWPDLRPATYTLSIDSYRYLMPESPTHFTVSEAEAVALAKDPTRPPTDLGTLTLREATLLRGQVTDVDSGQGVGQVLLQLLDAPGIEGRSDASGYYRLGPLVAGDYTVAVSRPRGYAVLGDRLRPVHVAGGTVTQAPDVAVKRGVSVWGRVLDADNAPVPDANVFVSFDGTMRKDTGVRTKADGTFLIGGFWHDTNVRIWAELLDAGSFGAGPLAVGEQDLRGVTLTLSEPRRGRIEGRVQRPGGGGVGGALVHCRTPDPSMHGPLETRCDAEGGFVLDALLPGDYQLEATAPDQQVTAAPVAVSLDGRTTERGLVLEIRPAT